MISKESIEKIKSSTNIVDVLGEFITLSKHGTNFLACCPFHNEKTPSFTVSPARNNYKCFGCGKSGDSISFLQDHEGMTYPESLRYLAKLSKVEVVEDATPDENNETRLKVESLKLINKFAKSHFASKATFKKASEFFAMRGISDESITEFGLGYASEDSNTLFHDALKAGFKEELLKELGLRTSGEKEYDFFRGRAIYPIEHPMYGHIIGFAGRTLKSKHEIEEYKKKTNFIIPKFINSKESALYEKGKVLYNYFRAKQEITKQNLAITVEGYHDVISLHQKKIKNVVAPCGTALTVDQIKLIKKRTQNIAFMMDGDEAGQKSTVKGIDLCLQEGMTVWIVPLPKDHDPDSWAREHSEDEIRKLILDRTEFIYYLVKQLYDKSKDSPSDKSAAIKQIQATIALIPDLVTRNENIKVACRIFEIRKEDFEKDMAPVKKMESESEPGMFINFDEHTKKSIKARNQVFLYTSKDEAIKESINKSNLLLANETVDKKELKELKKLTKSVVFDQHVEDLFIDQQSTEADEIQICKLLTSNGFDVSIKKNLEKFGFDVETGDVKEGYEYLNFVDYYINKLVAKISPANQSSKTIAIERTAEIVSFLSETGRITYSNYVRQCFKNKDILFSDAKFEKVLKTYLKKNHQEREEKKETTIKVENPNNLNEEQLETLQKYGLYYHKNQIFYESKDQGLKAYSNFTMNPILHTIGINNVQKIFELTNVLNIKAMISIGTDVLNSIDKFCAKCEEKGNYRFDGYKFELRKLKHFLMDQTVYSYEIEDLGWQRDGFWAWADGVSNLKNEFNPIDEYGLVTVDKKSYYLKPFSKMYADDKTVFVNERNFRFKTSKTTFKEFTTKYVGIFGEKAKLNIVGYLTTLFGDFIFAKKGKLPIFNCFGPKGTGKTEQIMALQYLFGDRPDIINISSATPFASAYLLKIFVNSICLIDEYKNDIGVDRIEFLKSLYNRVGRVRGSIKEGVKVEKIPVNSMIWLCGQEMPTFDVALLSRCIYISNYKDKHTQEEKDRFNELQDVCREGLAHITQELLQYRILVETDFEDNFHVVEKQLKEKLSDTDSRLIENHAIILSVYKSLETKLELDFSYEDLMHISLASIREQMNILTSSNELAVFWNTMVSMLDRKIINDQHNFVIEHIISITLKVEIEGESKDHQFNFAQPKKLIFLRWDGVYQLFAEMAAKARSEIMPEKSLLYYLEHSKGYLGKLKSKRFVDNINQAWVFDYDLLGVNLERTHDAMKLVESGITYQDESASKDKQDKASKKANEPKIIIVKESVNNENEKELVDAPPF